ncbi:MAG: hypothetical protein SGARI_000414 [Bacillariaceae sp.]
MGIIKCVSICPKGHDFGEVCGAKKARKSGCFCKDCYHRAKGLLIPGNTKLTRSQQAQLQAMMEINNKTWKEQQKYNTKGNGKRRKNAALVAKDQEAQNKSRKAKRHTKTALKRGGGNLAAIVDNARNEQYKKKESVLNMMEIKVDFVAELAEEDYLALLAACATDATTKALADYAISAKKFNNDTVQLYAHSSGYDHAAPPKIKTSLVFSTRSKKTSIRMLLHSYDATDKEMLDHIETVSNTVDALRKKVYKEYDCGVTSRQDGGANTDCAFCSIQKVKELVEETIVDAEWKAIFMGILDGTLKKVNDREFDEDDLGVMVEALRNGTVFVGSASETAWHWIPDILKFGFPSSHALYCEFNRELWDRLISLVPDRRKALALFVMIWAALDGSILKGYVGVLIPDDDEVQEFFYEIIKELHDGEPYSIKTYTKPSLVGGKDIRDIRVSTKKLCSEFLKVLSDDNKFVPTKKAEWIRKHAKRYHDSRGRQGRLDPEDIEDWSDEDDEAFGEIVLEEFATIETGPKALRMQSTRKSRRQSVRKAATAAAKRSDEDSVDSDGDSVESGMTDSDGSHVRKPAAAKPKRAVATKRKRVAAAESDGGDSDDSGTCYSDGWDADSDEDEDW